MHISNHMTAMLHSSVLSKFDLIIIIKCTATCQIFTDVTVFSLPFKTFLLLPNVMSRLGNEIYKPAPLLSTTCWLSAREHTPPWPPFTPSPPDYHTALLVIISHPEECALKARNHCLNCWKRPENSNRFIKEARFNLQFY